MTTGVFTKQLEIAQVAPPFKKGVTIFAQILDPSPSHHVTINLLRFCESKTKIILSL